VTYLGIKIAATGLLLLAISTAFLQMNKPPVLWMVVVLACFAGGISAIVVGLLIAIWL